jgi:hypothetical protein
LRQKSKIEIILVKEKLDRKPIHDLRALLFFLIIFFSLASVALGQGSPQIRRLPPSLERELKLKHGGKIRIVGFVDTLKAQNIIAQSIRDSSSEELDSLTAKDSAIIVIDSSVSLTDKEWLDSMLVQLPEYKMTPEGIRFYYPADILVETNRKVVPHDTTLPSRMDPVTKEDLPLYDAFPMPRPLRQFSFPRTSIELGAGSPYVPRIDVASLVLSNERSAIELNGKFRTTSASDPAIKQFWNIGADGSFAFPQESIPPGQRTPQLDIQVSTGANKRLIVSQIDSAAHTLSESNLGADFIIGDPTQLKLSSHASVSLLSDDIGKGNTETGVNLGALLTKTILDSAYQIALDIHFQNASRISNISSQALSLFEPKLTFEQKSNDLFRWKVGISYLSGSDAGGSTSVISPLAAIRFRLSNDLEIGANFEPKPQLIGLKELLAENLFYSPNIEELVNPSSGMFSGDHRRIVTEPFHLNIFANYFLSLDNEVHGEFRYIVRNNEPVFDSSSDKMGHTIFITDLVNTDRVEFEAGGSVMLFTKDKFRASILFRSISVRDGIIKILPFEPTAQIQAAYQFGNISEKFIPQIELMELQRPNHNFAFINLDAKYMFSSAFQLKVRAENIFGSAGDFWTGYNEYPRSVWVSGEYRF